MSGERNPFQEAKLGVIQGGAWADMLPVEGDLTKDINVLKDYQRNLAVIIKDGKIIRIRFHSNHFSRTRFPRLSRNLTHSRIRRCGYLSSPRFAYFYLPISCANFHTGLRMYCRTV